MIRHPRYTLFPYTTLFRSRLAPPDELGQRHGEAESGMEAQAREVGAEARLRAGDPEIGHQREAQAPAHRVPVDRAHDGLRSEEHTSELQSQFHLVCRLLLE